MKHHTARRAHRNAAARGPRALFGAAFALGLTVNCTPPNQRALPTTASPNARVYAAECDEGVPTSCYALGLIYAIGPDSAQGLPHDPARARSLFDYACGAGVPAACEASEDLGD